MIFTPTCRWSRFPTACAPSLFNVYLATLLVAATCAPGSLAEEAAQIILEGQDTSIRFGSEGDGAAPTIARQADQKLLAVDGSIRVSDLLEVDGSMNISDFHVQNGAISVASFTVGGESLATVCASSCPPCPSPAAPVSGFMELSTDVSNPGFFANGLISSQWVPHSRSTPASPQFTVVSGGTGPASYIEIVAEGVYEFEMSNWKCLAGSCGLATGFYLGVTEPFMFALDSTANTIKPCAWRGDNTLSHVKCRRRLTPGNRVTLLQYGGITAVGPATGGRALLTILRLQ